jgi:glutaredoxin-like protein NrdH
MADHKVKLYALSTCGHCRNLKRFLDDNAVVYEVEDVDLCGAERKQEIIAEIKDVNPRMGFPTLFVDDKVIVGFREDEVREALGLK